MQKRQICRILLKPSKVRLRNVTTSSNCIFLLNFNYIFDFFQVKKLWIDRFSFSSDNANVTKNDNAENNVNENEANNNANINNVISDVNNVNDNRYEAGQLGGRHNHILAAEVA